MIPVSKDAYKLLHDGSEALALVEAAGIRIDVDYLKRARSETQERCKRIENKLKQTEVWREWTKEFGRKADLGSRDQLATVLFERMGYEVEKKTKKSERPSGDEEHLLTTGEPFVKGYLKLHKLRKADSTYLLGLLRETVDGFFHSGVALNKVITYRSSSYFHTIPKHDPEIGKLIRPAIVPREGNMLIEVDYGALEFRVAASFWADEAMIRYASDPAKDVHRDMAAACYKLEPNRVPKEARQAAKNQFVFPTLYGSYWKNTGKGVWAHGEDVKLSCVACEGSGKNSKGKECVSCEGKGGQPLRDHLRAKGIGDLESFVDHVHRVEDREFMGRFKQFAARREPWWDKYRKRGWFEMPTGFVCQGVFSRNFIYNAPIQGPGFHCLLWSLIQIVRELKRRGMRSLVIGTIHDSIMFDAPREEVSELLAIVKRVMTEDVREHYDWIKTPLEIEAEGSSVSWYDKEELEIAV